MLDPTIYPQAFNTVSYKYMDHKFMSGVLNGTIGSWSTPLEEGESPAATFLNSHKQETRAPLQYSEDDLKQIEKWGKYQ